MKQIRLVDLEPDLRDLRRAARLAEKQLHNAISNLAFVDGKYTEVPDAEEAELAIFAVESVARRAEELEQMFNRCSENGGVQPERTHR